MPQQLYSNFDRTASVPNRARPLVQEAKSSARILQIILDCLIVVALLYLHTWLKEDTFFDSKYRSLAVLSVLLMLVIYPLIGVYRLNMPVLSRTLRLLQAWALVIGSIIFTGFVTKTSALYSREIVLTWTFTGFFAQVFVYFFVWVAQKSDQQKRVPSIVVGSGELAAYLVDHINNDPWLPDRVVGLIGGDTKVDGLITGELSELSSIVESHNIRRVYLAMPMNESHHLKPIYEQLSLGQVDIIWAPDIFSVDLLNHSVRELARVPIISLSETPYVGWKNCTSKA